MSWKNIARGHDSESDSRPFRSQVGQTIKTVIDNPAQTSPYRGYAISLNNGTHNYLPGGSAVGQQVAAYPFDHFSYGKRLVDDLSGDHSTSLFYTDTGAAGLRLAVTLTSASTYQLTMTPLDHPAKAYSEGATLNLPGQPVSWLPVPLCNTTTDPLQPTDFYISNLNISGSSGEFVLLSEGQG